MMESGENTIELDDINSMLYERHLQLELQNRAVERKRNLKKTYAVNIILKIILVMEIITLLTGYIIYR